MTRTRPGTHLPRALYSPIWSQNHQKFHPPIPSPSETLFFEPATPITIK